VEASLQPSEKSNLGSIALLVLSGMGLVFSFLAAGLLALVGLMGVFGQAAQLDELLPMFALAWVSFMLGLLALPPVVFSTLRLLGREAPMPKMGSSFRLVSILIVLWPLALVAGNFVAGMSQLAWLLLPPLHVLAVSLPIWWLVELARNRLPGGSPQRSWGILNASLFITTPLVVLIEIVGLVILVVGVIIAVSMVPEWAIEIERLATRLALLQDNPEAILQVLQSLLDNPLTIFLALGILAGIVPLLEELFKPLAVWFLFGRRLTPQEGFAAGAICGGAFALLESLMTISSAQSEGWAALVIARTGTGLLHITTTALMGWALASAWHAPGSRWPAYLRLILAYLLAVTWHGLWNAMSVISGVGAVVSSPESQIAWVTRLSVVAPLALLVLVASLFVFLWGGNRMLRRQLTVSQPVG
jgi:hypothetical protein